MALQSDGKVVMAGGTSTAFDLARFDVDGTLDDSFGPGGTVTTDIGGSSPRRRRWVSPSSPTA